MSWFLLVLLSVLSNTGMFICFKKLQAHMKIEVYLFYAWSISSFVIALIYIPKNKVFINPNLLIVIILAGLASWVGNYAYNFSIRLQPNIGYVEALSSVRIAITFIASLIFFSSPFEVKRVLALLGLVSGCYLITVQIHKQDRLINKKWIIWSLISGICFALLALLTKTALIMGMKATVFTCLFLLVASVLYLGTLLSKSYTLEVPVKLIPFTLIASFFAVLANIFLYSSYESAPNLAYPVAISNGRIVLLFLSSLLIGKERGSIIKGFGVVIVFISILVLS